MRLADSPVIPQDALLACINTKKRCDELPPGFPVPAKPSESPPPQAIIGDNELLGGKALPSFPLTRSEAVT